MPVWAAACAICIAPFVAAAAAGRPPAAQDLSAELRGVWVLRSTLTSPDAIDQMTAAAAAAGFNAVFVQVRARGDAYYATTREPRGTLLPAVPAGTAAAFDPLALTLTSAHARGLAVHAWVNVGLVSDAVRLPTAPSHVIRAHPEWLMVPRELAGWASATAPGAAYVDRLARWTRANTNTVEGLYVSPIHDGARAHAMAIARDLASRYPLDGLHLDYVRYPHDAFDYSAAALAAFRADVAAELPPAELASLDARVRTSPTIFADRYPQRWETFRRDRVTRLVAGMAAAARDARPGILISAAVLPDPLLARSVKLQDWPEWASRGIVDAICPMAYAEERPVFSTQVEAVLGAAGTTPVWTGIGAYRLTAAETAVRVREARRAGSAGVMLFSYDSVSSGRNRAYLRDVGRAVFPAVTGSTR